MCTFANSENSSYFVVLYNIRKKKTDVFVFNGLKHDDANWMW